MAKGLFVTFEGGDGSGKTTVMEELERRLSRRRISFLHTREPGGSVIAEEIRNVILDRKNTAMDERTEALLYAASRRQHLIEIVLPALRQGQLVLSDRYLDSSLAYQGYARGIGMDEVYAINLFATEKILPDLTFYLDLSPEQGLLRIAKNRDREVNRLDLEKENFHRKVYEGYQILLKKYPDRIKRIDATKSVEDEVDEIEGILLKRISS